MPPIWKDWQFYIAVLFAFLITVRASQPASTWQRASAFAVALFSALLFTDPLLTVLDAPWETFRNPVAAFVALTAERVALIILSLTKDDVFSLIGRGKK